MTDSSDDISDYILATISISCLVFYEFNIFFKTLLILASVYSVLSIWRPDRELHNDCEDVIECLQDLFSFLLPVLAWPCLIISMWIKHDVLESERTLFHTILSVCMFIVIIDHCAKKDMSDLLVGVNSICLVLVALFNRSLNPIYEAIFFIMAHFSTFYLRDNDVDDSTDDVHSYLLAAFVYYTMMWLHNRGVEKRIQSEVYNDST